MLNVRRQGQICCRHPLSSTYIMPISCEKGLKFSDIGKDQNRMTLVVAVLIGASKMSVVSGIIMKQRFHLS